MKKIVLMLTLSMLVGASAMAGVTGLYNTGVDNSFVVLADGTADGHYTLTSPTGTAIAIAKHPAWVGPGAAAKWIGPTTSDVTDPVGWYIYQLTFTVAADPANVTISGQWATDNDSEIWLNGNDTGYAKNLYGYQTLADFTLSNYLQSGQNVLEFRVYNASGDTGNPTGLLVTNLSGTVVPAPGAILLAGIGTSLVGLLRRRRAL